MKVHGARFIALLATLAGGGRAAIEAVANLEAKLRIFEPTYTADGTWRVNRKDRMRIDVFIAGRRPD